MDPDKNPEKTPQEISDQIAKSFFGVTDEASRKKAVWQLLLAAVVCAFLIPLIFLLRFGEVDGFAWGVTVFFIVYCLLAAVGLYFRPRSEFHTPVRLVGDWLDRIGAFWLVSCAFGPFLGWLITSILPITVGSWRWVYGARAFLAVGLPLITALPMIRYLRGRAVLVGLPILLVVTLLPVLSAVNVSRDLWQGPVVEQVQQLDGPALVLPHTGQILEPSR